MKLNLRKTGPSPYDFESFMDDSRHQKLMQRLFVSTFRQLIYGGGDREVLEDLAEECQSMEELLYIALKLGHSQRFIEQMGQEMPSLRSKIALLGALPADRCIAEREEFLRDIEQIYIEGMDRLKQSGDL